VSGKKILSKNVGDYLLGYTGLEKDLKQVENNISKARGERQQKMTELGLGGRNKVNTGLQDIQTEQKVKVRKSEYYKGSS
jgi:hypothetical protein